MLGVSLSSCHRYHPAEVDRSYQSVFDRSCCLRPWAGGSAFGAHSRGHLCVHSRYGPMTRNLPFGGLVGRLHELGYPLPCYPSYRALIITLAGLTPAEHTSLRWTHNRACGTTAPGSPGGSCNSHSDNGVAPWSFSCSKTCTVPVSTPCLESVGHQACLRPDSTPWRAWHATWLLHFRM